MNFLKSVWNKVKICYYKNDLLIESIIIGNLEQIKYLVSLGADIRSGNDFAVRLASADGHLEVVKYLVSLGADIRCFDDYAVRWASRNGHLEMVKYLVSIGADIRSQDDFAVQWASYNGHLELVKYLVSLGADISKISAKHKKYIAFSEKNEKESYGKSTEEDLLLVDSHLLRYSKGMW